MKRLTRMGVLAGLAAVASASPFLRAGDRDPREGACRVSEADDSSLGNIATRWRDAYNAGDAQQVASLYTPEGQYLSAHVHARGREAVRAYFQRGIDAGGHIDGIRVINSRSDGTLAYAVGTYEANNAGQRVDGRILLVLEKRDQDWLIVAHEVVVRDQP